VFSSPFYPKNFGFWPTILQNGTKHQAKLLAKRYPFSILDFGIKRQKKPKSQKALTHPMKNLVFWMELNTPIKILAFCISSFQSSWHFAFHGELDIALITIVVCTGTAESIVFVRTKRPSQICNLVFQAGNGD
jgi:hypothetical protein